MRSSSRPFFTTLKYRHVGPYRGGRVTAVTGIPEEPLTYFFGASGGGVWQKDDGGHTWKNITDGFLNVGSVGAITLAPSYSAVIYVGTGSACPPWKATHSTLSPLSNLSCLPGCAASRKAEIAGICISDALTK